MRRISRCGARSLWQTAGSPHAKNFHGRVTRPWDLVFVIYVADLAKK